MPTVLAHTVGGGQFPVPLWTIDISPRALGVWLVAYTTLVLAGAAAWGRAWLREGEGFAVLFGLLAVLVVAAAIPLFDAVRLFPWWTNDVVGVRGDWSRTFVHSLGLAFTIAVVALVWVGATRAGARSAPTTRCRS
ncbi:MAG: hypothetical protein H0W25_08870 [Acidimicrobiia bacterium]|nr:hypothetical protein [Acidimicrobiia bacterium]